MKKTTILLAEDHAVVREGIRSLLSMRSDFEVVAEAASGREAVEQSREFQPNIIIMDVAMPGLNGFEATRQIQAISPLSKVLVLSAHFEDEYVAKMDFAGAAGYLIKQDSGKMLFHAIKEITEGRSYYCPTIARRIRETQRKARENGVQANHQRPSLTVRESEVLQLVAEGSANKQIAAILGISIKTVEKHRQQLMDKLDLHDTANLTRFAIATGVVDCSIYRSSQVHPVILSREKASGATIRRKFPRNSSRQHPSPASAPR